MELLEEVMTTLLNKHYSGILQDHRRSTWKGDMGKKCEEQVLGTAGGR